MSLQSVRNRLAVAVIVAFSLSGCAAHSLREAQDHFNKGSEIELRALDRSLLSDSPAAGPGDAVAAANEYRLAQAAATRLLAENAVELKQDNLLGATYLLKAMALWRISDLEGNRVTAPGSSEPVRSGPRTTNPRQEMIAVLDEMGRLDKNGAIVLGTRDRVLYKALYGFYDHDGGRGENDYLKARTWYLSAYDRLQEAVGDDVPKGHPIRVYIVSAQLRTLAAWNLALYEARKTNKCLPTAQTEVCVLAGKDPKAIMERHNSAVCAVQYFWETNEDVYSGLLKLSFTIGLPFDKNYCR
jgi:hypothetical protein